MKKNNFPAQAAMAILIILALAQANAFAQVQFPTATGVFNSPRAVNENIMTDIVVNGNLKAASTGQRILVSGANAANLPNGVYICPGVINFATEPQIFWAYSQFIATSPYPVNIARAPAGNVNDRNVPIQFDQSTFQAMTAFTVYPSDSLYSSVLTPAQEDVGYINVTGSTPVTGRSHGGLVCIGTYTINGHTQSLSSPISGQTISQPAGSQSVAYSGSDLGQKTVSANMAVSSCKGAIGTFVEDVGIDRLRKYIYLVNTDAAVSSSAQFTLTVADPRSISPEVNSVLPNPIKIGAGESANVTFTISNNDPVEISLASATASNGFIIAGLAGWTDPIAPNSVAKRNATITATQPYSGAFNISLGFSTATPVCDGSTLTAVVNTTESNNGGPKTCALNSSSIVAAQYNVSRGGSYPVQAQCTDDNGAPIACGDGFVWATSLDGGAMVPDTTIADPHISNLTVSLTAPNQTGKDITATYTGTPAFNCSLLPLHSIAVGPDQNVTGCSLSCPEITTNSNQVVIGQNYTIQAICLNQFGAGVACNKDFNWSTTIINATMEPNVTIRPVDTSTLVVSPDATNQTGKNVNVTEATGNFTCNFPAGLSVVYAKACTINAPSKVQLNAEVLPTVTFTFPFTADIPFNCGYGGEITLACNSTAGTITFCQPKNPAIDKCQYGIPNIGYSMTASYQGATCSHAITLAQQNTCYYYI